MLGAQPALPSEFGDLESAGAVIGEVRVEARNIFDPGDAAESGLFYRLVNRLHFVTRPQVVARMLLFKSGDRVSVQKIEETERILLALRILRDVEIRPGQYRDGKVDVEVLTRDTWSLDLTGSFSRSGGNNKSSFGVRERNALGTGLNMGFARASDNDRNGTELEASYNQAFDGWTQVAFSRGQFSDGRRTAVTVDRPFYSLDTRYAARGAWSDNERIDSIYNSGDKVSEYRHRERAAELAVGWSPGLVDGWTSRYSGGIHTNDDAYRAEPGRALVVPLPVNHRVRAPFLRYELVEDDFIKVVNYNNIARTEFLGIGFHLRAQVAHALRGLGSTRSDWLYALEAGNGTTFASGHRLFAQAKVERRVSSLATPMTQGGAGLQFYAPQSRDSLYFASLAGEKVQGGGIADRLLLGGLEGMRGYPSHYQAGKNRVVATLEQRRYFDWYPLHLVRVGGAAFLDIGRAWGGANQNSVNGGWLADAGMGLRLSLDRTASANVLHLDVAVPLRRAPGIKAVQFLVKTELTY